MSEKKQRKLNRKIQIGDKFGRLKVVNTSPKRDVNGTCYWACVCECGNFKEAQTCYLNKNKTVSCGCWGKEKARNSLKQNSYSNTRKKPSGIASFQHLLGKYEETALERGFLFELNENEFRNLTIQNCYYCDKSPSQKHHPKGFNGCYIYNGIDRINSKIGYNINNCVPCCWVCNRMKYTLSKEDFLFHVKKIAARF